MLAQILRLLPLQRKASRTARLVYMEQLSRAAWTPRHYDAYVQQGYARNAVVFRCVRMVVEMSASIPWILYRGRDEVEAHPLLAILARPNPRISGAAFFEALFSHQLLSGNAYVEAVLLDGALRELHLLRPDRVKVVPGPDGWAAAHDYTAGSRTLRIEQAGEPLPPVLHLSTFHPLDDHYGMSPMEAAATALDTHNATAAWHKALIDNSARPSGALVYDGADGAPLGKDQFDRLKSELEESFQGSANAGRPLLLEGGLDWKPMALAPKELDFAEARNAAAREIALAFGVPPLLLGLPGDNTYANFQEANRAFLRATVLPLVQRTAQSFAAWLAPLYGADLRLEPDLDRIEALAGEREALWRRITAADFLTPDEKRAAVGYGRQGGGANGAGETGEGR